jgi:hypothetical protein
MTWLLDPANFVRVVVLLGVAVLSSWATQSCMGPAEEPPVQTRVETDTVYRERQITRRDTVTETVPREVIRYDTVSVVQRDTIQIEVPTVDTVIADTTTQVPWRPFGLISARPVRVDGRVFTLSYYQLAAQRWEQRTYEAQPDVDEWRLTSGLKAMAGPDFGVATADLQVRHRTPIGWVGLGPAAIAHADRWSEADLSAGTGIGATVTFESTLYSR